MIQFFKTQSNSIIAVYSAKSLGQENIKKLKDLEHKERIELENQKKVNEAIRLNRIHQ